MCLSSVYNKTPDAENLLLRNVQFFKIEGEYVVCTDILAQDMRIHGTLVSADLVNGQVIVDVA